LGRAHICRLAMVLNLINVSCGGRQRKRESKTLGYLEATLSGERSFGTIFAPST
jgi:hypothetical protein